MLIAIYPVLAIVLGLLMWALCTPRAPDQKGNAILARAGEIIFTCGTLVTLFVLAHVTFRLG
jgi:heme/copper-type cytochrome/quinol oxidase subunit 2